MAGSDRVRESVRRVRAHFGGIGADHCAAAEFVADGENFALPARVDDHVAGIVRDGDLAYGIARVVGGEIPSRERRSALFGDGQHEYAALDGDLGREPAAHRPAVQPVVHLVLHGFVDGVNDRIRSYLDRERKINAVFVRIALEFVSRAGGGRGGGEPFAFRDEDLFLADGHGAHDGFGKRARAAGEQHREEHCRYAHDDAYRDERKGETPAPFEDGDARRLFFGEYAVIKPRERHGEVFGERLEFARSRADHTALPLGDRVARGAYRLRQRLLIFAEPLSRCPYEIAERGGVEGPREGLAFERRAEQFFHARAEDGGYLAEEGDVRLVDSALPLGDGLQMHAEKFGEPRLSQSLSLAQFFESSSELHAPYPSAFMSFCRHACRSRRARGAGARTRLLMQ